VLRLVLPRPVQPPASAVGLLLATWGSDLVLATASGQASKSEQHGYGQNEFVPWQLRAVM